MSAVEDVGIIENIEEVDVSFIESMPIRIRKMDVYEKELLRKSVTELGYVEPIQVCKYTEKCELVNRAPPFYLIVNGQHRFDVLVKDFDAKKVSVVVLGENWDKMKYWSEAIRLNNIKGDYDLVKLAYRIKDLKERFSDVEILREKLGFTVSDKIFERAISFIEKLDGKKAKEIKKKAESGGMGLDELSKSLSEVVSKSGQLGNKFIAFTYRGLDFVVFECDDDMWRRVIGFRRKFGVDKLYEVFKSWVVNLSS